MSSIFVVAVSFGIALLSWMKERNFYNPAFLMSVLWGLITLFADMRLYNMFGASDMTYKVIFLGIIAFAIGCFIICTLNIQIKTGKTIKLFVPSENAFLYYRATRVICIISILLLAYPAYKSIGYLTSGLDMSYIRTEENVVVYTNPILRLVYNYIVRPFSFAILPIFAVDFFVSQKRDKIITISSIVVVVERVLIEGGRFVILYIICSLLMGFVMTKKKLKIKKSVIVLLVIILAVATIAIYQVSLSRGTEDIGYSLYVYFCGVVPHLSIRLDRIVYAGQHTYGLSFFSGILTFVFAIFENLGFSPPYFFTSVKALMNVEDGVAITSELGSSFNAFVGPYFYMFLDGGYLGVFLGMMAYGMISYYFYKRLVKNFSYRDMTFYILIVQGIVTSMVRFQFVNVYYTLAFVYIYFLINKREKYSTSIKDKMK